MNSKGPNGSNGNGGTNREKKVQSYDDYSEYDFDFQAPLSEKRSRRQGMEQKSSEISAMGSRKDARPDHWEYDVPDFIVEVVEDDDVYGY